MRVENCSSGANGNSAANDTEFVDIIEEDLAKLEQFEITDKDMQVARPKVIEITFDDLLKYVSQEISIDEKDLPPIINIRMADLPPILDIKLADLPPDFNFMTTECYHGTSWQAAEKIRKGGFKVGHGSALGSGIYFSVGGISIARGYAKGTQPCIIRARVDWGRVAYLDDSKLPRNLKGGGNRVTKAAINAGYNSFINSSKYSKSKPAIGIVLGAIGTTIRPPRIEVIELMESAAR